MLLAGGEACELCNDVCSNGSIPLRWKGSPRYWSTLCLSPLLCLLHSPESLGNCHRTERWWNLMERWSQGPSPSQHTQSLKRPGRGRYTMVGRSLPTDVCWWHDFGLSWRFHAWAFYNGSLFTDEGLGLIQMGGSGASCFITCFFSRTKHTGAP